MLQKLTLAVNNEMHFMNSKPNNEKLSKSTTDYGYPKFLAS